MRNRLRHLRTPVAAVAVAALVGVSAAPASADGTDDPVGGLLDTVTKQVQKTTEQLSQAAPEPSAPSPDAVSKNAPSKTSSKSAPAPSSDDDSPGHETENPSEPDHAQGRAADVGLGDQDVASVGNDKATVEDDDSTRAYSTLLALGGNEVVGAHASSNGKNEDTFDPLAPVCSGTDGKLCLSVLYSHASASDDGTTSTSKSGSEVASACLGGTKTDPETECDGPAEVGVIQNGGEVERDQQSGRTTGSSHSSVANLCLADDPVTGCALGADLLSSEGRADSGNSPGSAHRSSSLAGLTLNGQETGVDDATSEPNALSIPPGCDDPSLLCAFLNQGETYLGDGVAGHAQEALQVKLLGGTGDVLADLARTETLVHNDGGNGGNGANPGDGGNGGSPGNGGTPNGNGAGPGLPGSGGPGGAGATPLSSAPPSDAGALPNTGGIAAALVALGLIAVAAGAFVTAYGRKLDGASLRR